MEDLNKKLTELKTMLSDAMITQIDLDLKIKLVCKLNEALSIANVVKSLPPDTDGCSNDRDKCACKDWGGCPVD